jgi:hypothetical protein
VDLLGNYFVTTSSGLGETPGDDFVVTLGTFANSIGTPFDRAATLAHEFGHNLGLTHCNESTCSVIGPYGPNHASIMSYAYQLRGVRTAMLCDGLIPPQAAYLFKDLDYSNGTMCSLNETYLDETMGTTMRQVDWNCDGYLNLSVVQDLSSDQYLGGPDPGWCGNYGSQQTIHDEDEWSSIVDVAAQKTADQLKRLPMTSCITAEEATRYAQKWSCPTPVLASEACVAGRAMYVVAGARGFPTGNCTAPYGSVQSAVSAAPSTSSLFLSPATYSVTAGGSYVLNKPLKFFAVKGARMQ